MLGTPQASTQFILPRLHMEQGTRRREKTVAEYPLSVLLCHSSLVCERAVVVVESGE